MNVRPAGLAGILIVDPTVVSDDRGAFLETYQRERYAAMGMTDDFVQDNHSRSRRHTIRGLHYQLEPGQVKLVRVARGSVLDVVVDIRRRSPTFGEWEAFELDDVENRQLYIPNGFAHGFCTTSDLADVVYKVSSFYHPDAERGIAWDDPDLDIPWPANDPIVSDRDRGNPRLKEAAEELAT